METFDEIWQSSHYNFWAWVFYGIIGTGMASILRVQFRNLHGRRASRIIWIIVITTLLASLASGARIGRKWELRQQWVIAHENQVTEDERSAAFGDGANLILGPAIESTEAFLLLVSAACISSVLVSIMRVIAQKRPICSKTLL